MPLKIGSEDVGGLKIGAELVGGMKIGSEIVYRAGAAPPPPTPDHRYSIVVGQQRGGILGYWFNNIGNIADSAYALPNGVNAIIRQTMTGGSIGAELRFLISSGGVTVNSLDQFPHTITTTRAGTTISWTRPATLQSFGQGIGTDYTTTEARLITTVFQNGQTVAVALDW